MRYYRRFSKHWWERVVGWWFEKKFFGGENFGNWNKIRNETIWKMKQNLKMKRSESETKLKNETIWKVKQNSKMKRFGKWKKNSKMKRFGKWNKILKWNDLESEAKFENETFWKVKQNSKMKPCGIFQIFLNNFLFFFSNFST